MNFLYATDLHGSIPKYEAVLATAIELGHHLIHLGADLLPKGPGLLSLQEKFIKGYLKEFHRRCDEKGIKVLSFFGNDDVYTRKKYYLKYASLLDETPYTQDGWEYRAYGYVPIYPFSLRTACKLDHPGWVYRDSPCDTMDVGPQGFVRIDDPDKWFAQKGTIEGDLAAIKGHDHLVMAIHCPPEGLNLDVCMNGRRVGSKAVYDWIQREQPAMVLCGHIHENYTKTGAWTAHVGRTIIIQPGQSGEKTDMVVIENGRPFLVSK